jgi:hypothetical protein
MASRPSGYDRAEHELVVIETSELSLYIKGRPYHERYETLKQYRSLSSVQEEKMTFRCGPDVESVQVFDVDEGRLVPATEHAPIFFENGVYQLVVSSKKEKTLRFHHEHPAMRKAVSLVGREPHQLLMGNLQFTNEVGLSTFEIHDEEKKLLEVTLEIFPSKLDYKEDYRNLLQEVNEEVYNLAFHFVKKTYLGASAIVSKTPSMAEFYRLFDAHFASFLKAIQRIEQQPHHELRTVHEKVRGDQLKRLDSRGRQYLRKRPQLFQKVGRGITMNQQTMMPVHGLNAKKDLSFDTFENRFVKWMMVRLIDKLAELLWKVEESGNPFKVEADSWLVEKILYMKHSLEGKTKMPFWRGIGELDRSVMSLVMQMKTGYKEAYQIFLIVSRGLTLQGQLYKMSVKDVALLYEYWTFLKLGQILGRKYETVKQDIVKVNLEGLFVNLDQSKSARRVFRHPQTEEEITLHFQKNERSMPTVYQKPDTMLTITKKGKDFTYNFVFDAKYRIDFASEDSYYQRKYDSPGPLEEDINTMHRYRDALVVQQNEPYERTAFGAYVLFPWFDEDSYENHSFYKSIDKVNIGGLPFLPNTTRLVEQFLDHLIEKNPEEIQEEGILPRGTKEEWMSGLDDKVMVGVVKNEPNYRVHRMEKFYHIPVSQLKKGWQEAKYLALYLPKRVSQEKNGIYFYGEITDVKIKRRNQIKSLPSNKQNDYAVIYVDGWRTLDAVIPPVGYGIRVYTMTTLNTLKQAKELPELFMKLKEEVTLWRMLRRISNRVRTELNHDYLDQATGIQGYSVRDIRVNLNRANETLRLSRQGNTKEIPIDWLRKQPTRVFKEMIDFLE